MSNYRDVYNKKTKSVNRTRTVTIPKQFLERLELTKREFDEEEKLSIPSKQKTHNMKLDQIWFDYIKSGDKTIEGRLNDDKRKEISVSDIIIFTCNQTEENISTIVTDMKCYNSFGDALDDLNITDVLPNVEGYPEAVNIYLSIPGYAVKQKKFGVVFFNIERI